MKTPRTNCLCLLLLILLAQACRKPVLPEQVPVQTHDAERPVGRAARELLSDSIYTSLTLEVQYMTGYAPDSAALGNLRSFLFRHVHKPAGIRTVITEIPPAKDTLNSLEEVAAIEKQYRTRYSKEGDAVVYLLYTNGVFIEPEMLGYAYRSNSAVVFGKNLHENSNTRRRPARTDLETKVLQHELGHLMGLVNVGTPLQSEHKDAAHGKHCSNRRCLMYYLIDTEESPTFLLQKPLPRLCAACRRDLRANGGK
ncbi:hypothetical protein [Flaviaesturariibacter amylovorans]|uniref:Peptidase n=1 Tax=Flaviaesturariibacter amylovorans TaxID=1084520 RepID=A0ABP8HCX9_9BACT